MTMGHDRGSSARAIVRVFELRERRSRLALARITQDIDEKRGILRAADNMLGVIGEQMKASADARFSGGSRTVAELLESEEHVRTLRQTQARLAGMKRDAEGALESLAESRRKLARLWYRDETKRSCADAFHKNAQAAQCARQVESDEEDQARPVSGIAQTTHDAGSAR
jgi:hypothetical protein